jgi:predicted metal-dependent peptidase
MINKSDPLTRIAAARIWALQSGNASVLFYGTLALNLRDVIDANTATASTDGRVIRWSPKFVEGLSDEQVKFVLLHEVLHCAHGHFWRLPISREGNIAGDYAINRTLRTVAGIKPPAGVLDDRKFDRLAEEEILKALRQQPPCKQQPPCQQPQDGEGQPQPQDGQQDGAGNGDGDTETTPQSAKGGKSKQTAPQQPSDEGGCGGFEQPAPDAPAPEADEDGKPAVAKPTTLKDEWDRNVVQAAQTVQSLQQGRAPADAERLLARIRVSARPDWRAETSEFIRSATPTRTDWSRQARRTALAPVIYPRRQRDEVGTVVFVRDTSGSVSTDLVAKFNSHIRDLMEDTGCDAIVLDADAVVQAEHRLSAGDDVPDRASGGGGTDFRPAFTRVRELIDDGERIAGVVYLTDMLGYFPAEADVDAATLWVATTDVPAPFGRTVRIET